jgi:hypothetical protein
MAWDNMAYITTQHDGMVHHSIGQHDTHHDSMMMAWSIMAWDSMIHITTILLHDDGMVHHHGMGQHDTHHDSMMMA